MFTLSIFFTVPSANAQSLLGGETVRVNDSAVSVQLGYPELRVGYHIPIVDGLEIAPRFTFFYAGGGNRLAATLNPPQVGLAFAADIKWNFYSSSRFHIAAVWRIGFNMEFLDGFDAALQIGIPGGIAMNYEVNDKIDLLFGVDMNSGVVMTTDPAVFNIPFVFHIGTAIDIRRNMDLTLTFEGGPTVAAINVAGKSGSLVSGWVAGFIGLDFYL